MHRTAATSGPYVASHSAGIIFEVVAIVVFQYSRVLFRFIWIVGLFFSSLVLFCNFYLI